MVPPPQHVHGDHHQRSTTAGAASTATTARSTPPTVIGLMPCSATMAGALPPPSASYEQGFRDALLHQQRLAAGASGLGVVATTTPGGAAVHTIPFSHHHHHHHAAGVATAVPSSYFAAMPAPTQAGILGSHYPHHAMMVPSFATMIATNPATATLHPSSSALPSPSGVAPISSQHHRDALTALMVERQRRAAALAMSHSGTAAAKMASPATMVGAGVVPLPSSQTAQPQQPRPIMTPSEFLRQKLSGGSHLSASRLALLRQQSAAFAAAAVARGPTAATAAAFPSTTTMAAIDARRMSTVSTASQSCATAPPGASTPATPKTILAHKNPAVSVAPTSPLTVGSVAGAGTGTAAAPKKLFVQQSAAATAAAARARGLTPSGAKKGSDSTHPVDCDYFIDSIREQDVLCGRGGRSNHHPGNKKYRQLISDMKHSYRNIEAKAAKTDLSRAIVEHVFKYGGRFVKVDARSGKHYALTTIEARKKTSQALRECKQLKWLN
eukprot:CAMPEP_0119546038 /NCGR_PEP_ID=MMETSP1352-20130426/613_1 /TAXON_ID=265584 /ORGANISM="Stauroneis constricta, Strain CCMP1120" /LENGTH=496 /DNA_ID=CAMNT_0007590691 /DNA_START=99 /DNA_END=1589 /DNA_ORIENTATION=+